MHTTGVVHKLYWVPPTAPLTLLIHAVVPKALRP